MRPRFVSFVTFERILVKCADIKEDNILHLAIS